MLGLRLPRHAPGAPDLGSPGRLALAALAVMLIAGVILGVQWWDVLDGALGDTDDAMRLVLVRGLLSGQGWWDQHLVRFQPPVGVYMHWSQLLTGAIAAMDALLKLFLSSDDAELVTRFVFPLLWIFPGALAALMIARRLAWGAMGVATVLICAVILASDLPLYVQFHPGRIDHHDVQIVLCLLAMAGAVQASPNLKGALLAGVATGLGLAIGLEALVFDALIGAAIAIRFALDPARESRSAQAYGASLAATAGLAFAIQTPPWRWSVVACDALAWNSVAALVVAGAGLAVICGAARRASFPMRVAAIALVGATAAAVYLGLDLNCRHGWDADVDPRIRPIWLNYVQEVRPIWKALKRSPDEAIPLIVPEVMGVLAWLFIGRRPERRRETAWWLGGALLLLSVAAGSAAVRMSYYAMWFAAPMIAAAAADLSTRYAKAGVLTALFAGGLFTPVVATGLSLAAAKPFLHKKAPASVKGAKPGVAKPVVAAKPAKKVAPPEDECFDDASYDELSNAQPAGLVLSEVDLGPFILADTADSAMAGPYHRMGWGIVKAHGLLRAPADGASAALVRQAGVAYVLECRFHARHGDRDDMKPDSLQKRLDAGKPPAWLQPLSPKAAPLQAYRVLPAGVTMRASPALSALPSPPAAPLPKAHA